ncbi:MAG: Ig-like domain-containing protein [bacterium]
MRSGKTLRVIGILATFGALALGCGDDDGTQAVCGNGLIEGDETCDGSALGGSTCTTVPGDFTGGTLGCTNLCELDTSQCTSTTAECGNDTQEETEDCDGLDLDGNTCSSVPGGFTGGTLACTTLCAFDTSGCTNVATSDQIQAVIDAVDASGLALEIGGAWVTYVKPAVGNEDAGFFLQAEQLGPALYVAVDPATLTPVPAVGDEVSLTVVTKVTQNGQPRATEISGFSVASSGHDFMSLLQDVTDASDLITALDDYTSELITATGTLSGDMQFAGQGHVAATFDTSAIAGNTDLRLRIPDALNAALGLELGCVLTVVATPVWRFDTRVQLSAWVSEDITVTSCPAPQVVQAVAMDMNTVHVTFNRDLDAGSVLADGSQFTFDNGLTASAATASGNTATITTSAQVSGTLYTVTVAATVTDVHGTGVDAAANTAQFSGYAAFAADLLLWELDCDQTGNDPAEFVELWNNSGAAIDFATAKYFVLLVNGNNDQIYDTFQLTGTVADGAVFVLGNNTGADQSLGGGTAVLQNGPDGILLVRCDTCTDATTDFSAATALGTTATFTTDGGQTATKVDGVVYVTGDTATASLLSVIGVTAQWDESAGAGSTTDSLHRTTPGVWAPSAPSPGSL